MLQVTISTKNKKNNKTQEISRFAVALRDTEREDTSRVAWSRGLSAKKPKRSKKSYDLQMHCATDCAAQKEEDKIRNLKFISAT